MLLNADLLTAFNIHVFIVPFTQENNWKNLCIGIAGLLNVDLLLYFFNTGAIIMFISIFAC